MADRDTICEMQVIVRAAGYPHEPGGSVKASIRRAAGRLGLTFRRARTFWAGDRRAAVRSDEADRLREWYADFVARRAERLEQELLELRAAEAALGDRLNATRLALRGVRVQGGGGRHAIRQRVVRAEGV